MSANKKSQTNPHNASAERLYGTAGMTLQAEMAKPLAAGLYLVSTPIGNLADMSLRALATLARADLVFCEDTRHSRKLFTHFGMSRDLEAYNDHSAARERPRIIARLRAGQSIAVIADAGTPLVSDPGNKLVRAARQEGLLVFAVPGPSALLAGLAVSGLPTDRFFFEGFLPPRTVARKKRLEAVKSVPSTLVFYEAPSRLQASLTDMAAVLDDREGVVAKELTKLHEGTLRGSLGQLANAAGGTFGEKGEFVVLVGPPGRREASDEDITEELGKAMKKATLRDSVQQVAEHLGVPRNRVYKLALAYRETAR